MCSRSPSKFKPNIVHTQQFPDSRFLIPPTMSHRNGGGGGGTRGSPKLDLKLNLQSPQQQQKQAEDSSSRSAAVSPSSPAGSSCVSEEDSPKTASMVVVGCQRCLMYVMISPDDPKCPKCMTTVLLGFQPHDSCNTTTNCHGK